MGALEFLKEWRRICKKEIECYKCPISNICMNSMDGRDDKELENAIQAIERWSKEHPKKTYKDVFLEVFPSAPTREDGTPKACVIDVFGENSVDCKTSGYCGWCWDRECKEDEE